MAVTIGRRPITELLDANCLASDDVGDVVYITGPRIAGKYQVTTIDTDVEPPQLVFGLIIIKTASTDCVVQVGGLIHNIYSGLSPGKPLFVNTAGRLTHTIPVTPVSGVRYSHLVALALADDVIRLQFMLPIGL